MRTILTLVISYALACLAAGAVAEILMFLPGTRLGLQADPSLGSIVQPVLQMWLTLSLMTAVAAAIPFAVAIALLKWRRITSLLAYTLAGAIVGIAGMIVLDMRFVAPQTIIANWPIIVAGAVAGFTYRLCEKLVLASLAQPVTP